MFPGRGRATIHGMDTEIVPMRSVKLDFGRYEVVGTTHAVEVWRAGSRRWWLQVFGTCTLAVCDPTAHVTVTGGRCNIGPFPSKRAALQFAQSEPEL